MFYATAGLTALAVIGLVYRWWEHRRFHRAVTDWERPYDSWTPTHTYESRYLDDVRNEVARR